MRVMMLAATLLSLSIHAGHARPLQAAYPQVIRQIIDNERASCRADNGQFTLERDAIEKIADINGDGAPEYVLHYGGLLCSSWGGSAYCGTAGCEAEILVSSPRGYLTAFDDNYHELKIVQAGGKPALRLSLHGSTCGKVGAAVCIQTLVWKGQGLGPVGKPGFDPARPHQFPSATAVAAPAAAPVTPPPPPMAKWSIIAVNDRGGKAAMLMHSGGFSQIAVACVEGSPMFLGELDGPAPRAGQATLRLAAGDKAIELPLRYDAGSRKWMGNAPDNRIYDLMTGPWAEADAAIDGRPIGRLSLSGSMTAARAALAGCAGSPAPPPAAAGASAIGPLGIRTGYYVSAADRCEAASSVLVYDGGRIGFVYGRDDTPGPVGRIERRRDGSFLLPASGLEIKPLGADRIKVTAEDDVTMRLCAASTLPPELRR